MSHITTNCMSGLKRRRQCRHATRQRAHHQHGLIVMLLWVAMLTSTRAYARSIVLMKEPESSASGLPSSSSRKLQQWGIDQDAIVTLVNQQRAAHGSAPLKWDATIAASAQRWADNCVTAHSLSAYGENLSLLNSDNYYNALNAWYKELCIYNFAKPGTTPQAGHFTQVVWASTTRIGCAMGNCPSGVRDRTGRRWPGQLFVCQYSAQGNINMGNMYAQNVKSLRSGYPNPCASSKGL